MSMELKATYRRNSVALSVRVRCATRRPYQGTRFPLLDRRGGCAHKENGPVPLRAQTGWWIKIRRISGGLIYHPVRGYQRKLRDVSSLCRVHPSCPGGEPPSLKRPARCASLLIGVIVFVLLAPTASAHDIPNDVSIHLFLKPEGQRVQLLVRAPLAAMQDVQYTKLPSGFVDLTQIDFPLRNAAKLWIANNF